MPVYFLPYPRNVLAAAAGSSANSKDHGEAMRDPGKGVSSLPVMQGLDCTLGQQH